MPEKKISRPSTSELNRTKMDATAAAEAVGHPGIGNARSLPRNGAINDTHTQTRTHTRQSRVLATLRRRTTKKAVAPVAPPAAAASASEPP